MENMKESVGQTMGPESLERTVGLANLTPEERAVRWRAERENVERQAGIQVQVIRDGLLRVETSEGSAGRLEFVSIVRRGRPEYLSIIDSYVRSELRRNGIMKALVLKMLEDNPEFRRVNGCIRETNEEQFNEAKRAGKPLVQSALETPIGKVLSSAGFTNIVILNEKLLSIEARY